MGVKRPGLVFDQSSPSSAVFKNELSRLYAFMVWTRKISPIRPFTDYRLAREEHRKIAVKLDMHAFKLSFLKYGEQFPLALRSKASVCGRSLAGISGSNPSRGHGCLSVVSVVCCQVEVCVTS